MYLGNEGVSRSARWHQERNAVSRSILTQTEREVTATNWSSKAMRLLRQIASPCEVALRRSRYPP